MTVVGVTLLVVAVIALRPSSEQSPLRYPLLDAPQSSVSPAPVRADESHPVIRSLPAPTTPGSAAIGPVMPAPAPGVYTVQPADTLSSISTHFGLAGYQRLYAANLAAIGPDPDLIRPGQVLTIPLA